MTREDFKAWLETLDEEQLSHVFAVISEAVFGNDIDDMETMPQIRQHVYDCFPEHH